jgi:DNA-binding CsgD family transcriptional regulator
VAVVINSLSPKAIALYERLVLDGPMDSVAQDGQALAELDELGLTFRSPCHPGKVVPVSTEAATDLLLDSIRREVADQHRALDAVLADIGRWQREFAATRSAAGSAGAAEVLADPDEIMRMADEVIFGARVEALEFAVATHHQDLASVEAPVKSPVGPGVRHRVVYSTACLASDLGQQLIRLHREAGEEQRMYSGWLTSLRVADTDLALVPLASGSQRTALLVRSPAMITLLRQWFETVWENATPPHSGSELTAFELEVLRLQALGYKDAAIARALGVSVRTVRRHVTNILGVLGVSTRFAAGVAAFRRGWITG